jgi:hypothetical protein
VVRGGAWNNNGNNVRAANRNRNAPTDTNNNVGFRCARSLAMTCQPEYAVSTDAARVPGK